MYRNFFTSKVPGSKFQFPDMCATAFGLDIEYWKFDIKYLSFVLFDQPGGGTEALASIPFLSDDFCFNCRLLPVARLQPFQIVSNCELVARSESSP